MGGGHLVVQALREGQRNDQWVAGKRGHGLAATARPGGLGGQRLVLPKHLDQAATAEYRAMGHMVGS